MDTSIESSDVWVCMQEHEALEKFRHREAALYDLVRWSLPTRHSRRTQAELAQPEQVWVLERESLFAFVWQLNEQQGEASAKWLGAARRVPGEGLQLLGPAEPLPGLPEALTSLTRVDFEEQLLAPIVEPAAAEGPVVDGSPRAVAMRARERIDAFVRDQTPGGHELERSGPNSPQWSLAGPELRREVAAVLLQQDVRNFSLDADDDKQVALLVREVPFYVGCRLLRLIDRRGPRSRFASFVWQPAGDGRDHELCLLGRVSGPIHRFNKRLREQRPSRLRLDADTAVAYLVFFCEFVHGEEGAFPLIEHAGELRWLPGDPQERRAMEEIIEPARLWQFDEPAGPPPPGHDDSWRIQFRCRAFMGYGRHVFLSVLDLQSDGFIDMAEDERVHERELPIVPLSYDEEFMFELRTPAREAR